MRPEDIVGIPADAEGVARALERHRNYRVLRRIEPMVRRERPFTRTAACTVAVVDVETTGLDWKRDKVIELGVQIVEVDHHGRIVATGRPQGWFEDPGIPIPAEITKVTKISDDMVRGNVIADGPAFCLLSGADYVLSHHAAFDRPFVEKRLSLPPKKWVCSLMDIDWQAQGFRGRKLEDLLLQCRWFFDGAHRAVNDVNALLHLLDHQLDDGRTVLKELLTNAARPTWLIEARGAPYESRTALRDRKYVWDPGRKFWWTHVPDERVLSEQHWLAENVYRGGPGPTVSEITWTERYAARSDD